MLHVFSLTKLLPLSLYVEIYSKIPGSSPCFKSTKSLPVFLFHLLTFDMLQWWGHQSRQDTQYSALGGFQRRNQLQQFANIRDFFSLYAQTYTDRAQYTHEDLIYCRSISICDIF